MSVTQIAGQTEIKPMSKTNVGANLMFALRTINEPMTKTHTFPDIGLIPVIVWRANIRFDPTLVLLIGLFRFYLQFELTHKIL